MSKTHFLPAAWRAVFTLVLLALAAFVAPLAQAQSNFPPDRLTYQGFLVDGNGNALATNAPKNYDVIFRIYPTQTGGSNTVLWGEQQTVTVDKGYFSVLLGEGTVVGTRPSFASLLGNSTNSSERYVGLTVKGIGVGNSDVDILPRLRLLPAPYAFLARGANALVSNGGSNIVTVSGNAVSISGPLAATSFSGTFTGSAAGLTGLTTNQIPNLDASKIATGTLNTSRIPALDANKITTGTLDASRIPNLDANKITTGTLDANRIPNLDASKINAGSLADARLSTNVALRSGGNTFSGQQTFNNHLVMANATKLHGVNSAGGVEDCLIPRWSDNATYLNFGAGGWYIRNNNATTRIFVRDSGEVGFKMTNPTYTVDVNGTVRADNIINSSDRRLKENFVQVDTRTVLEKVAALPITRWNFTNETGTVHLGPMAQDFHAAFGLGTNDTVISTTDAQGVALAAIQGLNEKVRAENRSLRDSLEAKDTELQSVKERLAALEELVRKNLVGAQRAAK